MRAPLPRKMSIYESMIMMAGQMTFWEYFLTYICGHLMSATLKSIFYQCSFF